MLDTLSVARSLGYHKRALLRRVDALGALVTAHVTEGKSGGFLFDDSGIALLRRLHELERDGLSVTAAVDRIRTEIGKPSAKGATASVTPTPTTVTDELTKELRAHINEQALMIKFLQEQLQTKDAQLQTKEEQIRALMPGPGAVQPTVVNGHGNQQFSRWRALKVFLLGKAAL